RLSRGRRRQRTARRACAGCLRRAARLRRGADMNNAAAHIGATRASAIYASAIYEGSVRHRRFSPRRHAFNYRVFMMYIDLDEIETLFDGVPLWSSRGPALACWRRADYFGDTARD